MLTFSAILCSAILVSREFDAARTFPVEGAHTHIWLHLVFCRVEGTFVAQAKVARKSGWRGVNPKFVVLVAFSSRTSRTFFHVFPELSRSIGNAAPSEKDSRVARFPTGMCALEPPHQQHGEQALQRDGTVQEVTAQIEQTQAVDPIKPRVAALWSPRVVGKTSLLRHLAEREEHAERRERY